MIDEKLIAKYEDESDVFRHIVFLDSMIDFAFSIDGDFQDAFEIKFNE